VRIVFLTTSTLPKINVRVSGKGLTTPRCSDGPKGGLIFTHPYAFILQSFLAMASRRRLGKKLFRLLWPILLTVLVALLVALVTIVYGITRPPRRSHLITPQAFSQISGTARALKVTEETWRNRDGTGARGGYFAAPRARPAVVLLHRYGGDRSLLFNLGMKINEATSCTILWPDLRGHGLSPPLLDVVWQSRRR